MSPPDESSTEILPAGAERAAVEPPAVSPLGRTLGKFVIVEKLGRGGSGDVYRAEQQPLGRSVVIKVLRREVAMAPNRVERFLREAKLASRLDHPYAAHIYAFGAEPDGVLWIAMEHVRGSTLDELINGRGAIPAAIFGPLFGRLCEVVHTAHELGIIHRDIKGGNVMVIERAGQLLPKLLDFGIAKGDSPGDDQPPGDRTDDAQLADGLTGHGSTLGSPQYMSPEQWQRPSEVDARADVYALGVLAYRCISGHLPFRSHERLALVDAHLHLQPPPLAGIAPELAAVVMRALAKRPDDRWPSALAFAEALRSAGGGAAPEIVPIFDPAVRDAWTRAGPQPIADAIAHLAGAATTIEADAALRDVVAITCRWLAVLALSNPDVAGALQRPTADGEPMTPESPRDSVRARARGVVGRDDASPWIHLARAADAAAPGLPGLTAALANCDTLVALAERLDTRRTDPPGGWRRTAADLAADIAAAADALRAFEPLLQYRLVVGRAGGAESWQGPRRRDHERVVVWGDPLAAGEVGLLDPEGRVVARLSPLAQVMPPLPSAEPELFLLWRGGRGSARLVAAPWGFERDDDAAGQRFAALSTEESDASQDLGERSPYPGLAPYGIDDADRFVGREREIEAIANRLVRAPMIAVLGPSGVGKSSFIHAGLLPRLREHYQILTMRPGRHPLAALASLPALRGHDDPAARLRELGDSAQRGAIVIVDQLEELVTLCGDPDERRRFADVLARAADGPSAPVRIVVTLRDDFASVIESEAGFRGRFEVFVLGTPPPEALRRIVTEPAKRAGVTVEPRVVDDMVGEVAGTPAALPLLSFTTAQLWANRSRDARRRDTIENEAYTAIGGVAGALASYADEIYGSLAHRDRDVVRDVFARLVASDGTRIPAARGELEQLRGAKAVLAHLIDARLLVVRDDGGTDVVEIVHECLAERWPRLARWRSEDAADRALLGDVGAAARRWQDADRRPDLLWRGRALDELRRLAARSTALTDVERAFASDADRAERRTRRLRVAALAIAMTGLAAIAAVMAYLSIAANDSRDDAQVAAGSARAAASLAEERLTGSLIAQAKRELNDGRAPQALALLAEAMRRGADSRGIREMVAIASRSWRHERAILRGTSAVSLAMSPSGWVALGDQKGHIRWYGADGKLQLDMPTELGITTSLRRLPDDRLIAVGRDGIALIDTSRHVVGHVSTASSALAAMTGPGPDEITAVERNAVNTYTVAGKLLHTIDIPVTQGAAEPLFAPDGRHVLLHNANTITAIDVAAQRTREISHDTFGVSSQSADRKTIAFLDRERAIHVIAPDGEERRKLQTANHPYAIEVSATGDRIAAIGEHLITIFDGAGKVTTEVQIDALQSVAALRGDEMWTGGGDGVLRHYHRATLVASLPSLLTEIEELRLDGDLVVAISNDSTVALVDARAAQLTIDPPPCEAGITTASGIAGVEICGEREYLYHGRTLIGEGSEIGMGFVAVDRASGRSAATGREITVFAPGAKPIARTTARLGAIAFDDSDHLLVLEMPRGNAVWRWGYATDSWDHVVDTPGGRAIATAGGKVYVGFGDGQLVTYAQGREVARARLGDSIELLSTSRNGRYLAAQLATGAAAVVDLTAGTVQRLQPADALGGVPIFDDTGDLLVRTSRGSLSIWDRATGDDLIVNFDLLRGHINAAFTPDGRLEVNGRGAGLIDIPPDTRPIAEIVRDIECRVPLRVSAGRLEPSQVDCGR